MRQFGNQKPSFGSSPNGGFSFYKRAELSGKRKIFCMDDFLFLFARRKSKKYAHFSKYSIRLSLAHL